MSDDELSDLRRRRMAELQQQAYNQQYAQEDLERQRQQMEAQIQAVLMQILEPEARERLNTIKLTKPEFARSVEQQLVALAQSGRIGQRITDEQLKGILRQLTPAKREFSIRRKG